MLTIPRCRACAAAARYGDQRQRGCSEPPGYYRVHAVTMHPVASLRHRRKSPPRSANVLFALAAGTAGPLTTKMPPRTVAWQPARQATSCPGVPLLGRSAR